MHHRCVVQRLDTERVHAPGGLISEQVSSPQSDQIAVGGRPGHVKALRDIPKSELWLLRCKQIHHSNRLLHRLDWLDPPSTHRAALGLFTAQNARRRPRLIHSHHHPHHHRDSSPTTLTRQRAPPSVCRIARCYCLAQRDGNPSSTSRASSRSSSSSRQVKASRERKREAPCD